MDLKHFKKDLNLLQTKKEIHKFLEDSKRLKHKNISIIKENHYNVLMLLLWDNYQMMRRNKDVITLFFNRINSPMFNA